MIQFGDLEVVEKTFTREGGAVRTQAYNGIKFRRFESTKGKKEADAEGKPFTPFTEEQFVISNAAYALLNLEENALTQYKGKNGEVYLVALEDQDEVKPVAKFMRRSFSKADSTPQKKGRFFSNEFLAADLVAGGVLEGTGNGNQFLSLVPVESAGAPSQVKAIYQLVKDTTVSEADGEDDKAEDSRDF